MGFFPEKSKQEPKRTYTYIGIRTYLLHSNQALALHTHGFATACNPPTACNFATATANPLKTVQAILRMEPKRVEAVLDK